MYVCGDCFEDEDVSEFIADNATHTHCDYCGQASLDPIATHMDHVLDLVVRSIKTEWDDPAEELPYESREGGYQGTTYTTAELLFDLEFPTENDQLLNDVLDSIISDLWCERNYFAGSDSDQLLYSWQDFCDIAKHYTRYRFFPENLDDFAQPELQYTTILDEIGRIAFELGLVVETDEDWEIFRGRVHDPAIRLTTARELGTPPAKLAIFANRMSPSGIPMFYGSLDRATVIAEIFDETKDPCSAVTVARFTPVRALRLFDLTSLPTVPSIFSENRRHLRAGVMFIRGFLDDFAKPILKDGREHIEYVPSQIVTEFFRHRYVDEKGHSPDGIVFPSSRMADGISAVLFATNSQCLDRIGFYDYPTEQLLTIDSGSVLCARPGDPNSIRCRIKELWRRIFSVVSALFGSRDDNDEYRDEEPDIVDYLITR